MPYRRALTPTAFGLRLRAARLKSGLTYSELARRSGVHPATLHQLETGAVLDPRGSTICKIARTFGLSADTLLAGTEPELPTSTV